MVYEQDAGISRPAYRIAVCASKTDFSDSDFAWCDDSDIWADVYFAAGSGGDDASGTGDSSGSGGRSGHASSARAGSAVSGTVF